MLALAATTRDSLVLKPFPWAAGAGWLLSRPLWALFVADVTDILSIVNLLRRGLGSAGSFKRREISSAAPV